MAWLVDRRGWLFLSSHHAGMVRRVGTGPQSYLQAFTQPDASSAETLKAWRASAEAAWATPAHGLWVMVQERIVSEGVRGAG